MHAIKSRFSTVSMEGLERAKDRKTGKLVLVTAKYLYVVHTQINEHLLPVWGRKKNKRNCW